MEFTTEEMDLLTMMAGKYKKHLINTYEQELPLPPGVEADLLGDLLKQLDQFTDGTLPVERLQLGILETMYETLVKFDITDENNPMKTTRSKLLVAMHWAKKLN